MGRDYCIVRYLMSFLEWSRSSVDYGRRLVDSVVEGARTGEDEFLKKEALAPHLERSARQGLAPPSLGLVSDS